MEPNQNTFEDDVAAVMQTLPPAIRSYLGAGKYSAVAKELMGKYSLHIDQGATLERELAMLLMGIENPSEFALLLESEAAISGDTVRSIMEDLNAQVFVPLQQEMQRAANAPKSPKPLPPQMPRPTPPRPTAPPNPNVATLPPKVILPGAEVRSGVPAFKPSTQLDLPVGERAPMPPPAPGLRLANTHPRPQPAQPPMPRVAPPPPPNLPGAMPPRPTALGVIPPGGHFAPPRPPQPAMPSPIPAAAPIVPKPPAQPMPAAPQAPTPPAQQQPAPPKPYTVDPYREPLE